jgi:hypothetical protein
MCPPELKVDNLQNRDECGTRAMIMRYHYLTQHPAVFVKMTGLRQAELDGLLTDVLPRFGEAELARLSRPTRQQALGGGIAAIPLICPYFQGDHERPKHPQSGASG